MPIPTQSLAGRLGGDIGSSFGSGIAHGLERLAAQKQEQLMRRGKKEAFSQARIPEHLHDLLLSLPEKDLYNAIQSIDESEYNQSPLQQLMQQQGGTQGQQFLQPQQQEQVSNTLQQVRQQKNPVARELAQLQQQVPEEQETNQEQPVQEYPEEVLAPPVRRGPFSKKAGKNGETEQDIDRKLGKKSALAAVDELDADDRRIDEMTGLIDQLSDLSKSGKLDHPLKAAAIEAAKFKGFGLDLKSLLSPESQNFQKITNSFLKYAKEHFGSRMTEKEFQKFLDTFPTLTNSEEGRKLIYKTVKEMLAHEKAVTKASRSVLKDNNYIKPKDFYNQVQNRIKSTSSKLTDRVIDNVKKSEKEILKGLPPADQNQGKKKKNGDIVVKSVQNDQGDWEWVRE